MLPTRPLRAGCGSTTPVSRASCSAWVSTSTTAGITTAPPVPLPCAMPSRHLPTPSNLPWWMKIWSWVRRWVWGMPLWSAAVDALIPTWSPSTNSRPVPGLSPTTLVVWSLRPTLSSRAMWAGVAPGVFALTVTARPRPPWARAVRSTTRSGSPVSTVSKPG